MFDKNFFLDWLSELFSHCWSFGQKPNAGQFSIVLWQLTVINYLNALDNYRALCFDLIDVVIVKYHSLTLVVFTQVSYKGDVLTIFFIKYSISRHMIIYLRIH